MSKICRVCGEEKPLTAFEWRKDTNRHRNECMMCKIRLRDQRWKKSGKPQWFVESQRRKYNGRKVRCPDKLNARMAIRDALRYGEIEKPTSCQNCGNGGLIEGHHHLGYDRPLDVQWLCRKCHHQAHATEDHHV